jgi:exosortase H (IPTLxxWG-CTERM-specific)
MSVPRSGNQETLRFVGLFFLFAVVFTLLVQMSWIDRLVILPYTKLITSFGAGLLNLLGVTVEAQETLIRQGSFAVSIRRGCDGVVATILLVSACLAYPQPWKRRLSGVFWGYVLIFTLNLVRIVGLFVAGLKGSGQTFSFVHTYVSQFIVIALTMVFWIYWVGRERTLHS